MRANQEAVDAKQTGLTAEFHYKVTRKHASELENNMDDLYCNMPSHCKIGDVTVG